MQTPVLADRANHCNSCDWRVHGSTTALLVPTAAHYGCSVQISSPSDSCIPGDFVGVFTLTSGIPSSVQAE
jgi:hypothetical protein